jgi:hypothetical protein
VSAYFLAGDVRPVTQYVDPSYAWVADDWEGRPTTIGSTSRSRRCRKPDLRASVSHSS